MTDRKISELPAATLPLAGTEPTVVVQDGETRRVAARNSMPRLNPAQSVSYLHPFGPFTGAASSVPSDQAHGMPFLLRNPVVLNEIAIRTGTATAGAQARAAIYAQANNAGLPTGAPILATSPAATAVSNTTVVFGGLNFTLMPGVYWIFLTSSLANNYVRINGGTDFMPDMMAVPVLNSPVLNDGSSLCSRVPIAGGSMNFPTLTGSPANFTNLMNFQSTSMPAFGMGII